MRAQVLIEAATRAHLERFARQLTSRDDAEAQGVGWPTALHAFAQMLEESIEAWAVSFAGEVGCMLGVRGRTDGAWQLWFHSGELFAQHGRAFLRYARGLFAMLLDRFPVLHGLIDSRNPAMVRLSTWVGFDLAPVEPYGPLALPFHRAVLRRH
jgi:hypothetical protein